MIKKEWAGSVFELPDELVEEFNNLSKMIENDGTQMVALLWVKFYLKFDRYYQGEIQSIH